MKEVFVITGGSGRIGSYFVSKLSSIGHHTINLDVVKNENASVNIITDLTKDIDLSELSRALKEIRTNFERVSFVHIAGIVGDVAKADWVTDLDRLGYDISKNAFAVACISPAKIINYLAKDFYVTAVFISSMYATKAPHFELYLSSDKLQNPLPYGATKAAEIYAMKWLNNYFKGKLRLNCISPGGVESDNMPEEFKQSYLQKTLGNRFCGIDDIADTILFLLSDQSQSIFNQDITVDAGFA